MALYPLLRGGGAAPMQRMQRYRVQSARRGRSNASCD